MRRVLPLLLALALITGCGGDDGGSSSGGGGALVVSAAYVDEGPTLKRIRPRAQGRAFRINKRTSHITVVLSTPAELPAGADGRARTTSTNGRNR